MKIITLLILCAASHAHNLVINLEKKKSNLGEIGIVIFNSEHGFPQVANKAIYKDFISIKNFPYNIDLPEGEYAISVFHDENSNQKLDTNFINIPKEAFGFSNNVMGLMGPPSFHNAKFKVKKKSNQVNIELKQF